MSCLTAATRAAFVCHGAGSGALFGDAGHAGMVSAMRAAAPELVDRASGQPLYAAVVFVSAHWQTRGGFAVTAGARPRGSAAPGDPKLAARIGSLLEGAGVRCALDDRAGLDDVVYGPLNIMFPDLAEGRLQGIPVLSLSTAAGVDAALHARAGRALAPLSAGPQTKGASMGLHTKRSHRSTRP